MLLAALALALAAPGCSSDDPITGGEEGPDPNDKRAVALECITGEAGLEARNTGEKSIQVDGPGGPRIEFFVTGGEAESYQFKGLAQAAEQIGPSLLFVNQGTDEDLEKIETCLEEL